MSCENCKSGMTEEAKAVRVAAEMAQKYRLMCAAVIALAVSFIVMVLCVIWAITNAQSIANEAVLTALETVAEMEVITETTTTTTQTVEGDSATINNVDGEQYNDTASNYGGD